MKFELTEEQQQAALQLLQRVQLKGAEVGAYTQVVQALQKPVDEEAKK